MIEFGEGNLLKCEVEALVNTVNTVGVMGKGVALQFKQAYPENFRAYRRACELNEIALGSMFVFDRGVLGNRRYIVNFPTKQHWRSNSRIDDIARGLDDLVQVVESLAIQSIAIPALGCGNGGLNWADVGPLIDEKLRLLSARCVVFPPAGAPVAHEMPIATTKPKMTFGRAALLSLVSQYATRAMRERFDLIRPGASLLEIQKLMYLLQEAGQPLRLRFEKGRYGPYAENLNKVLESLEGHHIRGYGDRSQSVLRLEPIEIYDSGMKEAGDWLTDWPRVKEDVDRVLNTVDGWESAYGMELLGTVLYAARTDDGVTEDASQAIDYVRSWNQRKQATFPNEHILAAWDHMRNMRWF